MSNQVRFMRTHRLQWENSLNNYKELLKRDQSFRHGISMVPTSGIARQYYCEQKVEMEYLHGEIETEAKTEGEMLHERLVQMRKTSLNDLIKSIKKRKILIASFLILARFSNLIIAGVPDALVFLKGRPTYLIELKTTKGDTSRLWRDQLIQARVYGLILEEMGFDCSKLKLVVERIRRQEKLVGECKDNFLHELVAVLLRGGQKSVMSKTESTTHVIEYNRQDVIADLSWAEAYWLSGREPIPTTNIAKCRRCEYNDICSRSLVRAHGQKSLESF